MTAQKFRELALHLPESCESQHMNHPDFRVRGKIFATLGPQGDWGVVKLTPEEQEFFMQSEPEVFSPAPGAWGRRGYTKVLLKKAKTNTLRRALLLAWGNTAPPSRKPAESD